MEIVSRQVASQHTYVLRHEFLALPLPPPAAPALPPPPQPLEINIPPRFHSHRPHPNVPNRRLRLLDFNSDEEDAAQLNLIMSGSHPPPPRAPRGPIQAPQAVFDLDEPLPFEEEILGDSKFSQSTEKYTSVLLTLSYQMTIQLLNHHLLIFMSQRYLN